MNASNVADDAPLSSYDRYGVDLTAEASLLTPYDVTALSRRLTRTIDARRTLKHVAAGAIAALAMVAAGLAVKVQLALTPAAAPIVAAAPSCPCDAIAMAAKLTTPPVRMASSLSSLSPLSSLSSLSPLSSASSRSPSAAAVKLAFATRTTHETTATTHALPATSATAPPGTTTATATTPALPPATTDSEAVLGQGSRLRQQLSLFDDANRAFAAGDLHEAASVAVSLRERFPDSPLALEAGLVEVRALRDLGDRVHAREVLALLRASPAAAQKKAALAELTTSLTDPEPEPPPRFIIHSRDPNGLEGDR